MHDKAWVLAFDFGLQRIGVAGGHPALGIAHPLATITGVHQGEKFARIGALIDDMHPQALVVGLPFSLDGQEHEMTVRSRRFARQLAGRFRLPVYLVDERLTSAVASQMLNQAGVAGRRQKPMLDQVAAMTILATYFDLGANEALQPGGRSMALEKPLSDNLQ